jgi:7-cyano-7-deazaguanine synthase in queuosine biosynthesis
MKCLLYSGGLDSFLAREYLLSKNEEFDCVYFDIGTKYSQQEIAKIKSLPFSVKIYENILNMKTLEKEDAYVPNRNFLLCMLANSLGYDDILIGGTLSDRVDDNNKVIMNQLSTLLTSSKKKYINVDSPFWDFYKEDIIKWFIEKQNHYNYINSAHELTTKTFSCYNPGDIKHVSVKNSDSYQYLNKTFSFATRECLNCKACFRKASNISLTGMIIPFYNKKIMNDYKLEFDNTIMSSSRSQTSLSYINILEQMECHENNKRD